MPFPRISVVMPSYNQASYLEESIKSVLAQNYPNMEFMILDGGSTDESVSIINKYDSKLSYWRSYQDNGQTQSLIEGFDRATGDLLGWVNSDDVLLPGCLKRIADAYLAQPEAGLFGGNYHLIDAESKIIRSRRHPKNPEMFAHFGLFLVNQPGSFFKQKDYHSVGGLQADLVYTMDTNLYLKMLQKGTKFAYVNSYLSCFRIHPEAKTTARRDQQKKESQKMRRHDKTSRFRPVRTFGLLIYYLLQVFDGNFLFSLLDTQRLKGKDWRNS